MNYFEEWFTGLIDIKSYNPIKQRATATGEYNKHVGPAIRYARVTIALEPGNTFQVIDKLNAEISDYLKQQECFTPIIFGVLDVALTSYSVPINEFTLTIIDVNYDEISSPPIAFRLAAREACRVALTQALSL
jgi:hypothetical protein